MKRALVLVEHRQGVISDVTFEMLKAARGLGCEVDAVLLGSGCEEFLPVLQPQAHRVVISQSAELREFNYEAYQWVLVRLVRELNPAVVMLAHSAFGSDLGPSLAAELDAALVSDATGFRWEDDALVVSRGMYQGKVGADWRCPVQPVLAMVRPSSFRPETVDLGGSVVEWDGSGIPGTRTRFLRFEEIPTTGIDITRAEVIVAVGRGLKEAKNLVAVKQFADSIGAALAGSRPVIDAGWLPKEVQVGSSGRTVKPKVYIALGISGSFQHVAGMKGADTIIAVNKDPNAPIFGVAHYGIVDDMHKIIPVLGAKLAALKS